jgi:hypothetical protein
MCELVGQDLDRHLPGEVRVLGAVDLAHPALTELFSDVIVTEYFAYHVLLP